LHAFVPHTGADFRRDRNPDLGPSQTNVSELSPYIRHQLVTEQEPVDAVLDRHSPYAAEKFVHGVFWRTYWNGWFRQYPDAWRQYRSEMHDLHAADLQAGYEDALTAQSDIDAVDARVRKLVETVSAGG
jgi:deoxyribodipyrimidine photo-lyase